MQWFKDKNGMTYTSGAGKERVYLVDSLASLPENASYAMIGKEVFSPEGEKVNWIAFKRFHVRFVLENSLAWLTLELRMNAAPVWQPNHSSVKLWKFTLQVFPLKGLLRGKLPVAVDLERYKEKPWRWRGF